LPAVIYPEQNLLAIGVKDDFFEGMKEIALEGNEEKVREADKAVRGIFYDEPKKMAEWEELMSRYEFMEETIE